MSDREDLRLRVRSEEPPPPTASVVIRGGPDTPSLLQTHAKRLQRLYELDGEPVLGISVFVVLDDVGPASERGILAGKLRSYPSLYRSTVGRLTDAGFVLLPTFTRPHFTIVLPALETRERPRNCARPVAGQPVRWWLRGGTVAHVDIAADLNSEDETGLVWTFLDEAPDPSIIRPGEVVVAGSELTPAVCEVVDLVEKPAGTVVHLRVLPGTIEQYRRLLDRVGA